jgi:Tol biopolymer transport system component
MKFFSLLIFPLFFAACGGDTPQSEPSATQEEKILPAIDTAYVEGEPEKINLKNQEFFYPKYSPDGNSLLLTKANYSGIWKYNLGDQSLTELTDLPSAGFSFVSPDKSKNIYFISRDFDNNRRSIFKLFSVDKNSSETKLLYESALRLSSLSLSEDNSLIFLEDNSLKKINADNGDVESASNLTHPFYVLDQSKILKYYRGETSVVKDYSPSNLIWLEKLPGNNKLAVYIAGKGLVIIDDNGTENVIGNFSSPAISPDGRMIAYNIEKDDGHRILSSDIYVAVLGDSIKSYKITDTENEIEMNPSWSPKGDELVFNNYNGEIKTVKLKFVK